MSVEFRHPIGDQRELNPDERRCLRRAARFQEILSWLAGELGSDKPRTPSATVKDDPVEVASATRGFFGISTTEQKDRGWHHNAFADPFQQTLVMLILNKRLKDVVCG